MSRPLHKLSVRRLRKNLQRRACGLATGAIGCLVLLSTVIAEEPPTPQQAPLSQQELVRRGVEFLRQQPTENGRYSPHLSPGVTALVVTALLRSGVAPDDPSVAPSLEYLESLVRTNGGIHEEDTVYRNYETSLAVVCFAEANRDGRYKPLLKNADRFLKSLQWDDEEGHDRASFSYGGGGYGKHERPDMSNTQMLVDGLLATGNGPGDPALERAVLFMSRCQNVEAGTNDTPFAGLVNDGGFYYTCAAGGSSQAGEHLNGGLRSYGSMTYAGLKSMIYAGLGPHDPRVKAAYDWIRRHYTTAENPGLDDAGLYYYYHVFAKALDAIGEAELVDSDNVKHDWRRDLITELGKRQKPDGSWTNVNSRWMESDPNLVTAYALLALSYCHQPAEQ